WHGFLLDDVPVAKQTTRIRKGAARKRAAVTHEVDTPPNESLNGPMPATPSNSPNSQHAQGPSRRAPRAPRTLTATLLFAAVIAVAVNLRAGISSVGPVLEETIAAFGVSPAWAGAITAM